MHLDLIGFPAWRNLRWWLNRVRTGRINRLRNAADRVCIRMLALRITRGGERDPSSFMMRCFVWNRWRDTRAYGFGAFLRRDSLVEGLHDGPAIVFRIRNQIIFKILTIILLDQRPFLSGCLCITDPPASNRRNLPLGTWMWNLLGVRFHRGAVKFLKHRRSLLKVPPCYNFVTIPAKLDISNKEESA